MNLSEIDRLPPCPPRPLDGHKGTFGTVIVVGGCETMIGAPALCATAACRGGAGLVKVCTPGSILSSVLTLTPSATGILADENPAATVERLAQADPGQQAVLAVGPGLGLSMVHQTLVDLLLRTARAVVLDADGLNHLAAHGQVRPLPGPALVMTPHPGEFQRLAQPLGIHASPTDAQSRPAAAAALARAHQAVVLLKGYKTVVSDGRQVYVNKTGNPALATAGSGDVLTGLIASLIAQGVEAFDAAALGAYLHGLAADLWAEQYGHSGMTAEDLCRRLPDAFARHRRR